MDKNNFMCPYGTDCYIDNKCYCMNCIVPLENWIKLGDYIYDNTYCHITNKDIVDVVDVVDVVDIDFEYNEVNNEENNDNNIFNESYILHKNTDLAFFINNIESIETSLFKYNIIFKNNEIIIYTINDKNFFLTIMLIYIDVDMKNILKINIISDIRSDFIKSDTINKLIN